MRFVLFTCVEKNTRCGAHERIVNIHIRRGQISLCDVFIDPTGGLFELLQGTRKRKCVPAYSSARFIGAKNITSKATMGFAPCVSPFCKLPPKNIVKLASMEIAPAVVTVIVMISVSRFF